MPPVNKGAGFYTYEWRGDELDQKLKAGLGQALTEIGLRIEAKAKSQLRPSEQDDDGKWVEGGGHGKRTGTLQRSIHNAALGHDWGADGAQSDLGGQGAEPTEADDVLWIEVGSGLEYAMPVHENHYDPETLFFLSDAVDDMAPRVPAIVKKHVQAQA